MARHEQMAHEFAEFDDDMNQQILLCNNYSMSRMCEIVLPVMKKQKSGAVINISSIAGAVRLPYMTAYSASKAWVNAFTESISWEYPDITFQNVEPIFVTTNFTPNMEKFANEKSGSLLGVEAESFVEHALHRVGEQLRTSAHPKHMFWTTIVHFGVAVLPSSYLTFLNQFITCKIRDRSSQSYVQIICKNLTLKPMMIPLFGSLSDS